MSRERELEERVQFLEKTLNKLIVLSQLIITNGSLRSAFSSEWIQDTDRQLTEIIRKLEKEARVRETWDEMGSRPSSDFDKSDFGKSEARNIGKVKWFNHKNGYGFIEREGDFDLFVHNTCVEGKIVDGDSVEFDVGGTDKGPSAINVRKIEF